MQLKSIAPDKQISNLFEGKSDEESNQVRQKIIFAKTNIDKLISINGSKVFNPIIAGDYIYYNLKKAPEFLRDFITDKTERKYYYPIQYANLEFNIQPNN